MFKRTPILMNQNPGAGGGVAAPPAPAPTPSPAPAPAAQWFDAFSDPELKTWIQGAGVQGPEAAAAKAWSLEKMLGADRAGRTVVLPADMNDAAAMGQVYERLGRPTSAEGYKFTLPEGHDPEFVKVATGWFHGANLTQTQAQNVLNQYAEYSAKVVKAQQQAEQAALQAEHEALAKDWGGGDAAAVQRELARRAVAKLGLDEQAITALEKVTGFSKVMKAFAKVGEMLGEAKTEGFGEGGKFSLTPEAAKGRKQQLMADADWRKRAMQPNSAEWAEVQRLDGIIAASASQWGF